MSIIQQIQEKYAKLMAIIIALALIIFVVMLAFENGGGLFRSGNSNIVGRVNGKEIPIEPFEKKVEQQEAFMKQQSYGMQGPSTRYQAIEATWGQEVNRLLVLSEMEKLGMEVTKREMGDLLYGANPPQDLKQQFTDTATGQYNGALAKQQIDGVLKSGTPEQKIQLNAYFNQLEFIRLNDKYTSLLSNSINFPKWLIEKQTAENSQLARISYVREYYNSVPDSTIKITDKEIEDYLNKHKDEYKQDEETRSIAYVTFSALPSAADSIAARNRLVDLKPEFDTTHDIKLFLEAQGVQNYYDSYINGGRIQIAAKDSFLRIPVGTSYGPYIDGASYSMARLMGVRTQPDTVDFRHILIGLSQRDPQGQEIPVRDSATAYKLADSLRIAISKGSNFDSLVLQFSDDQGSKSNGGKYEKRTAGEMVPEFNDFIFGNPVGTKGIVNTQFGAHYIEILSQKGSSPAYKVAYLTAPIEVSNETDANASNRANLFAGESTDQKSFDANVEKLKSQGINKMIEGNIAANSYQLQAGLGRSLVKKIFEAKVGEVVQPEKIGDNYVVAIVTGIDKKGTKSVASARLMIEPILRNQKKAEIIAKKLNNATTLEAVAAAWGGKQIEVADSVRFDGTGGASAIGFEQKVIGAAFNPANKGKITPPIYGNSGVFVVRVDNIMATPVGNANVAEQRKQKYEQAKSGVYPQSALREAATVKDNRIKFY